MCKKEENSSGSLVITLSEKMDKEYPILKDTRISPSDFIGLMLLKNQLLEEYANFLTQIDEEIEEDFGDEDYEVSKSSIEKRMRRKQDTLLNQFVAAVQDELDK